MADVRKLFQYGQLAVEFFLYPDCDERCFVYQVSVCLWFSVAREERLHLFVRHKLAALRLRQPFLNASDDAALLRELMGSGSD